MAPYTQTSILWGVERGNTESIRRLMNALMIRDAGVTEATAAKESDLTASEQAVFVRIFNTAIAAGDNLLRNMARHFASARFSDEETIFQAANDFDRLAFPVVQDPGGTS
jgi:hypothetical protein